MFCTECGTNLNEDAKFCTGCGAKTKAAQGAEPKLEIELCENCGAKLNEGAEFCTSCGTKKGESGEAPKDANDSKPLPPGSAPYADAPLGYVGEDGQWWHVIIPHNMPKYEEGDFAFAFFTIHRIDVTPPSTFFKIPTLDLETSSTFHYLHKLTRPN